MLAFLSTICTALLSLIGFLYAYRVIFILIGLFRTKRFPPAKRLHRYAILIAARNEEAVIGHLLESIHRQSYPAELLTVFVVADNCTDRTAQIAQAHGAICFERTNSQKCTKGYALQYLIERIRLEYSDPPFEGYFIFDADNLLAPDFVQKMNDAFDAGEKIVTGYRSSKNFSDNCISAGYAFHWMRTARLENRGRSFLNIPVRIQGTGFLFAAAFVQNGWRYTSLTEDRAFSADAVLQDVCISYQHSAVFYDEQPVSLSVAIRQRLRWSKGHLLSFTETAHPLFVRMFHGNFRSRLAALDMLLTNFPSPVPLLLLKTIQAIIFGITAPLTLLLFPFSLVAEHLSAIPIAMILLCTERDRLPRCNPIKQIWFCLAFPLFGILGDLTTCIALFRKIRWDPIPHQAAYTIDTMHNRLPDARSTEALQHTADQQS